MSNITAPEPMSPPSTPRSTAPIRVATAAAVATVAAIAIIIALVNLGNDAGSGTAPLELSMASNDPTASCLPVDADTLATMSPALAATVTSVDGETVTLDVDRWYSGGDAATVKLHATQGMEALTAGFDFEPGRSYLITAFQGSVNFCGYSGPATPDLSALFDQAFGS